MHERRKFLRGAGLAGGAVAAAAVRRMALAAMPEPALRTGAATAAPLVPATGRPCRPVVMRNGWTLPWRMNAGVKESHLVAEPVERKLAPGFTAHLWAYNGRTPGPAIEVVEGDRVRIFVSKRLPGTFMYHPHADEMMNGYDIDPGSYTPRVPTMTGTDGGPTPPPARQADVPTTFNQETAK